MPRKSACSPRCSNNFAEPAAMLTFNGNLKVYVALEPCDMRKSFNTLSALVRNHLSLDPLSGAAFLFTNKSRRLIKILYFDGTGYWVVAKRLEKGTFSWPKDIDGQRRKLVLKPTALAMLTDGIDLRDGLQRPWYELQ
jgi:transposase